MPSKRIRDAADVLHAIRRDRNYITIAEIAAMRGVSYQAAHSWVMRHVEVARIILDKAPQIYCLRADVVKHWRPEVTESNKRARDTSTKYKLAGYRYRPPAAEVESLVVDGVRAKAMLPVRNPTKIRSDKGVIKGKRAA